MQLFPQEPRERLTYLSLPHVLPPENVCGIIVTERDAAQGKELRFDYANREDDGLWSDLVSKIRVVCETVPGGVAVFFPSYQSLEKFTCFLHARGFDSGQGETFLCRVSRRQERVREVCSPCS